MSVSCQRAILIAAKKFNKIVHSAPGSEPDKVEAGRISFPADFAGFTVGDFLKMTSDGGWGVMSEILQFV